jgi:hypothetical protein
MYIKCVVKPYGYYMYVLKFNFFLFFKTPARFCLHFIDLRGSFHASVFGDNKRVSFLWSFEGLHVFKTHRQSFKFHKFYNYTICIIFMKYYSWSCVFYMLCFIFYMLCKTTLVRFEIFNHQCSCKHFFLVFLWSGWWWLISLAETCSWFYL